MSKRVDAVVVGGGIIGLAAALELTRRGRKTIVIEKGEPFREASRAAAGMLGAHVETHAPGPMFELCRRSLGMYRQWTDELAERTGVSAQYRSEGLLRVALTEDDEQELRGRLPWIGRYEWLSPEELASIQPGIAREARGGLFFKDDHQVHPVHLGRMLTAAFRQAGGELWTDTAALKLLHAGDKVTGMLTSRGSVEAEETVIAGGAWSAALLAEAGVRLDMMPVQGQCIAVRPAKPLLRQTVFTRGCYLVPRLDGTITIGATQQEIGFDQTATAAGIAHLHALAVSLLPDVQSAALAATWAGLRPGTRDGLPYIGRVAGLCGLLVATGHFRNGILLAPVTAAAIGQLADGETTSLDLTPFSPDRSSVEVVR